MSSDWIITPHPARSPAVRLVCVPDAGGDLTPFAPWHALLADAEVGLVRLPGRGSRVGGSCVESIAAAAAGVALAIARLPACPTVLFGHGVGALVAFETARRLEERCWPLVALFVSACRPPARGPFHATLASLPAERLLADAGRQGLLPEAAPADPDLLDVVLPGLRADYRMAAHYTREPGPALGCVLVACGGARDPSVSRDDMEGWRHETTGRSSVHLFTGGHRYLVPERVAVTRVLGNHLSVMLGALRRQSGGW